MHMYAQAYAYASTQYLAYSATNPQQTVQQTRKSVRAVRVCESGGIKECVNVKACVTGWK